MPKAILEYNLPEEQEDFDRARLGSYYSCVLDELRNHIRTKTKYGDLSEEQSAAYEDVRNRLYELMNDYGISD